MLSQQDCAGAGNNSLPLKKDEPSSIAVMTHEKRIYSNKVLSAMDFSVPPPGFNASVPPPGLPPPTIPPASSDNNDFNPAGDQSEHSLNDSNQFNVLQIHSMSTVKET